MTDFRQGSDPRPFARVASWLSFAFARPPTKLYWYYTDHPAAMDEDPITPYRDVRIDDLPRDLGFRPCHNADRSGHWSNPPRPEGD